MASKKKKTVMTYGDYKGQSGTVTTYGSYKNAYRETPKDRLDSFLSGVRKRREEEEKARMLTGAVNSAWEGSKSAQVRPFAGAAESMVRGSQTVQVKPFAGAAESMARGTQNAQVRPLIGATESMVRGSQAAQTMPFIGAAESMARGTQAAKVKPFEGAVNAGWQGSSTARTLPLVGAAESLWQGTQGTQKEKAKALGGAADSLWAGTNKIRQDQYMNTPEYVQDLKEATLEDTKERYKNKAWLQNWANRHNRRQYATGQGYEAYNENIGQLGEVNIQNFRDMQNKRTAGIEVGQYNNGLDPWMMNNAGLTIWNNEQSQYAEKSRKKAEETKRKGAEAVFDYIEELDNQKYENILYGNGYNSEEKQAAYDQLEERKKTYEQRRQETTDLLYEYMGAADTLQTVDYENVMAARTPEDIYNLFMPDDYEERTRFMTAEQKAKLDEMLLRTRQNAIESNTQDYDDYMAAARAYDQNVALGETVQKFRREYNDLYNNANTTDESGEYDPELIQVERDIIPVRENGVIKPFINYVPQGDEMDQAYFWMNFTPQDKGEERYNNPERVHKEFFATPEMVETFNKYYKYDKKHGTQTAKAFYDAISGYLSQQQGVYNDYYWRNESMDLLTGTKNRVLSPVTNMIGGGLGSIGTLATFLGSESAKDPNSFWYRTSDKTATTRDQQNSFLTDELNLGKWGKVVLSAVDSIADNLFSMYVAGTTTGNLQSKAAGWIVQGIMSTEATANTMLQKLEEGVDPSEAAMYAIGDGVIEWFTEKVSWDHFIKGDMRAMLGDKKRLAKFILENSAVEGAEEINSDLLNWGLDYALSYFYDHQNEIEKRYSELLATGMDPIQAYKQVLNEKWDEIVVDGAAGFLSGLVMSSGRAAGTNIQQRSLGSQIRDSGNGNQLIELGTQAAPGSFSQERALSMRSRLDNGGRVSNAQLGQLAQGINIESAEQIGQTRGEITRGAVTQLLTNNGMDQQQAEEMTGLVEKALENGIDNLSKKEQRAIHENKAAFDAYLSMRFSEKTSEAIEKRIEQKAPGAVQQSRALNELMTETALSKEAAKVKGRNVIDNDEYDKAEGEKVNGPRGIVVYEGEEGKRFNGRHAKLLGIKTVTNEKTGKPELKYEVQLSGESGTRFVDAYQIGTTNKGVGTIIEAHTNNRNFFETGYTNQLLDLMDRHNMQDQAGNFMMAAMTTRLAAYTGAQMPNTKIAPEVAQQMYNYSLQDYARTRANDIKTSTVVKPGQGTAYFRGAKYGTKAFDNALEKANNLTNEQKEFIRTWAEVAKQAGIANLQFTENAKDATTWGYENEKGITINLEGREVTEWDPKTGEAKAYGEKHDIGVTFSHEFIHWLQRNTTSGYDNLMRYVMDSQRQSIGTRELNTKILNRMQTTGESLDRAVSEIVAESCDSILSNKDVLDHIQQKNAGLYQNIKSFVKDLVQRVGRAVAGMGNSISSYNRQMIKASAKELAAHVNYAVDEAWGRAENGQTEQAGENAGNITRKSSATMFSNGIRIGLTDEQRYQLLKGTMIKIADATSKMTKQDIRHYNGMRTDKAKTEFTKLARKFNVIKNTGTQQYTNKYMNGTQVDFSNNSLRVSVQHQFNRFGTFAALMPVFDETFTNAVPVLMHGDRYLHTVNDKSDIDSYAILLGGFVYNNHLIPVQFEIKEYKNRGKDSLYIVATMKKGTVVKPGTSFDVTAGSRIPSEISIEDLISEVNPTQKNLLTSIPSAFLTKWQKTGKTEGIEEQGRYIQNKAQRANKKNTDTVNMTEDRIDKIIEEAEKNNKKTYMAYVDPSAFVDLTDTNRGKSETEGRTMIASEIEEDSTPYILIDSETGEIKNSDGKKRMLAMAKAGITNVAAVIVDDNAEANPNLKSVEINGVNGKTVTVEGLTAVNKQNRKSLVSTFSNSGSWYRYSKAQMDEEYKAVVKMGRYDLAEKMVDEAANKAGYTIKAYHGTPNGNFYVFDKNKVGTSTDFGKLGRGFYFTTKKQVADYYAGYLNNSKVMPVYLKLVNPFVINENYDNMSVRELYDSILGKGGIVDEQRSEELTKWLVDNGYDGIVADNEYMVLEPKNIKSAEVVTYDKYGEVIPLSERFNDEKTDIRWSKAAMDPQQEQLSQAWQQARDEANVLREQHMAMKPEMDAWVDRITEAQKNGNMDEVLEEYKEWEKGYTKLRDDLYEAEQRYKAANKAYDDYIEERDVAAERQKIIDSGMPEADYRRKQAADVFGYTTDFREAGYLLPNGKMLNFSGAGKGRHMGMRGEDHRGIGQIYASSRIQGGEAMMSFMRDGNIRVMAETPGIDMISTIEPTVDQYAAIRNMARRFAGEEYFNVDFTDENGYTQDSIEYDGRVNPDRVVNDIKTFYKTGVAPQQSTVSQFHYSQWTPESMDVHQWMMAQTPSSVQTEDELSLVNEYKRLRNSIDINLKRQLDYQSKVKQLERKGNLTAEERDELTKVQNRLEIQKQKLARLDQEMYEVTSSEGFAGLMYRENRKVKDYMQGKTQDQVRQTVEDMLAEVQKAQEQIRKDRAELQKLAGEQAVKTMKSYMGKSSLGKMAGLLRKNYNSTMSRGEIEARLAEIALKQANGEDIKTETETLAQDLIDRTRGIRSEALESLRGQTLVIGEETLKQLKAENSSMKELRSRLKGSGVTIKTEKNSRIAQQWEELRENNQALPTVDGMADIDALHTVVDFVEGELKASSGAEQFGLDINEVALVVKAMAGNVTTYLVNDPQARAQINSLMKQISELSEKTEKTAENMEALEKQMDDLLLAGQRAKGWTTILQRDVSDAIKYYNTVAKVAARTEKAQVRKQLIEQLRSENAKKLIAQQEKFNERLKNDREMRKLAEDNQVLRRQISTVVNRMANRIFAETDVKNVPEETKPLVRQVLGMFAMNDDEYRHVLMNDRKSRVDILQRLMRMEQAQGKFDMDADLGWLVTGSGQDADNSLKMRVIQDLMDIESGLLEYRSAEGLGKITLQDRKNGLEKAQKALNEIWNIVQARSTAEIAGRKWQVYELAELMREDMAKSNFKGERYGFGSKTKDYASASIFYGNLTPEYFFKRLKNRAINQLKQGLNDAENRGGLEAAKAQARLAEIAERNGFKTWDGQEKHQVKTNSGTIEMTTEQIMALYATWKRESNQLRPEETAHLLHGGFVLAQKERKGKPGRERQDIRPTRMNKDQLAALGSYLTEEQKNYVNEIVDYMSGDLAELGNEASMKMYGIKKFTEQFYFPIKSWGGVLNSRSDAGVNNSNENRAAQQSFSKRIQANARNAIEISDFTPTAAKHITGMITYNTVGPAVENMNKVLNQQLEYGEKEYGEGGEVLNDDTYKRNMRAAFQENYGKQAYEYLTQFMQDINGGLTRRNDVSLWDKLLSTFKKNAVAGSLSVAAQQPLSYIRAAMMINPKYMAQAISPKYWKGSYAEMMKYSGLAVIKDMGKFDMNYGQTMQEYITPEGMESKAKKRWDDFTDAVTSMPKKMDDMTWTRMWTATKLETAAQNPDMDVNSDEFMTKVAERFNEMVRRTQVYDSVMVKSQNMRSTHFRKKVITSFMAEPTLSLNVLEDAWANRKEKGGKANAIRALVTFVLSAAAQAGAKAFFGTGRSPKKDKNMEENFLNKYWNSFLSEINPLGLIPGYSQAIDLLTEGELKDDAAGMVGKAMDVVKKIFQLASGNVGNKGVYRDLEDSIGQFIQLISDVPAKNIMRDFRAMVNWFSGGTAKGLTGDDYAQRPTKPNVLWYDFVETFMSNDLVGAINKKLGDAGYGMKNADYYERIYRAEVSGNTEAAEGMREFLIQGKGASEKKMNEGIRGIVLDEYRAGNLTRAEAEKLYRQENPDVKDKDLLKALDKIDWEKAGNDPDGYSNYTPLYKAMDSNDNDEIRTAVKYMMDNGYKPSDIKKQVNEKYKPAYLAATNEKERLDIYNAMTVAYKAMGYSAEDAKKKIGEWIKERKEQ